MTNSAGSPTWQMVMLWVAGLFLLWETWRGWRSGLARSALQVAAVVGSFYLGFWAGKLAAAPFGGFKEISGLMTAVVVGGGVAVTSFLVFWILSVVLFKRTAQQRSGVFRFFWGVGGAAFGFLLGTAILWSAISLIRGAGALAEAQNSSSMDPVRRPAHSSPAHNSPVLNGVVKLKDSLELGQVGQVVTAVDPMPAEGYEMIRNMGRMSGNQEAMQRFLADPGIQRLIQNPKFVEFLNDPTVVKQAKDGNWLAMMSNPALLRAVQDPAFVAEVEKVNFPAALKSALENPSPSPTP